MTGIIILNWNGAKDTIACLESLYAAEGDFFAVVVDNGSTDGSVADICDYLKSAAVDFCTAKRGERMERPCRRRECIVFETMQNLGFAKGNNEALRFLAPHKAESYILLNNDTIVEKDFLVNLQEFSNRHPEYAALTPLICYEGDRELVWNCGGRQRWGFRKYFYARNRVSEIRETGSIDITFVTGCALFFRPDILLSDGGVFTERFFFGEEDFNFCLRMNRLGRKMACVLTSKIYHKVSSSTANNDPIGKTYIYYLNRYIDVKQNYSSLFYFFWKMVNFPNVIRILRRKGLSIIESIKWTLRLHRDACRKEGVSYEDFIRALK